MVGCHNWNVTGLQRVRCQGEGSQIVGCCIEDEGSQRVGCHSLGEGSQRVGCHSQDEGLISLFTLFTCKQVGRMQGSWCAQLGGHLGNPLVMPSVCTLLYPLRGGDMLCVTDFPGSLWKQSHAFRIIEVSEIREELTKKNKEDKNRSLELGTRKCILDFTDRACHRSCGKEGSEGRRSSVKLG